MCGAKLSQYNLTCLLQSASRSHQISVAMLNDPTKANKLYSPKTTATVVSTVIDIENIDLVWNTHQQTTKMLSDTATLNSIHCTII